MDREMEKTVLGVFSTREDAEAAIDALKDEGFDARDISVVMRDRTRMERREKEASDMASSAVSGAATGAAIGGLAGLVSAFVLPGLGALFIGGPLAAALGLTGAAAATVSGATTGAVAGGLIGALTNLGLSKDEAKYYEDRVREGSVLLTVGAAGTDIDRVMDIFEDFDASDVKTVNTSGDEEGMTRVRGKYSSMPPMGMKGGRMEGRRKRTRRKIF